MVTRKQDAPLLIVTRKQIPRLSWARDKNDSLHQYAPDDSRGNSTSLEASNAKQLAWATVSTHFINLESLIFHMDIQEDILLLDRHVALHEVLYKMHKDIYRFSTESGNECLAYMYVPLGGWWDRAGRRQEWQLLLCTTRVRSRPPKRSTGKMFLYR